MKRMITILLVLAAISACIAIERKLKTSRSNYGLVGGINGGWGIGTYLRPYGSYGYGYSDGYSNVYRPPGYAVYGYGSYGLPYGSGYGYYPYYWS